MAPFLAAILERVTRKGADHTLTPLEWPLVLTHLRSDEDRLNVFRLNKMRDDELRHHVEWRLHFIRDHWQTMWAGISPKHPAYDQLHLLDDIWNYFLPYAHALIEVKKEKAPDRPLLIGLSAIQGAGKTTQGDVMELLMSLLGYRLISRSIDDHYNTHAELSALRDQDPRYISRGLTHDLKLAVKDLQGLSRMKKGDVLLVAGYYKGAHHGDGDRYRWIDMRPGAEMKGRVVQKTLRVNKTMQNVSVFELTGISYKGKPIDIPDNMGGEIPLLDGFLPDDLLQFLQSASSSDAPITMSWQDQATRPTLRVQQGERAMDVPMVDDAGKPRIPTGWRIMDEAPDFIVYEGWMLFAQKVWWWVLSLHLPGIETKDELAFARKLNRRLSDYKKLWEMFDYRAILYVPNYKKAFDWRENQEQVLRARQKGKGKSPQEIIDFVNYFIRSVHYGVFPPRIARDRKTDMVAFIHDDHSLGPVVKPNRVPDIERLFHPTN